VLTKIVSLRTPPHLCGTAPRRNSRSQSVVRVLARPRPSTSSSKWMLSVSTVPKPLRKPLMRKKGNRSQNTPKAPFCPCIFNLPDRWNSAMTISRSSKSNWSNWCSARISYPSKYSSVSRSEPRISLRAERTSRGSGLRCAAGCGAMSDSLAPAVKLLVFPEMSPKLTVGAVAFNAGLTPMLLLLVPPYFWPAFALRVAISPS